jgi:integrase
MSHERHNKETLRNSNLALFELNVDKVEGSDKWDAMECFKQYVKYSNANKSSSTVVRQVPVVANYLTVCEELGLDYYSINAVNTFTKRLIERGKHSPLTINNVMLLSVMAFLSYLYKVGHKDVRIKKSEVVVLKTKTERKFILTEEHIKMLLNEDNLKRIPLDERRGAVKHLIILMWHTGMRFGDAADLKWEDVRFRQGVISILPIKTRRTGLRIEIPMAEELNNYLLKRKENEAYGKHVAVCPFSWNARFGRNNTQQTNAECKMQIDTPSNAKDKHIIGLLWYMKVIVQPLTKLKVNTVSFRYAKVHNLLQSGVSEASIQYVFGWSTLNLVRSYASIPTIAADQWVRAEQKILST